MTKVAKPQLPIYDVSAMMLVKMKLIPSLEMGRKTYQQTKGTCKYSKYPKS